MIFIEFGQIVRVNYAPELYFVYLVRDARDLWLFPVDQEIASGKEKVPFDAHAHPSLRRVSFREIKNIEVLHQPSPEQRGFAKYYGFRPNLVLDVVFQFARHLSFRFRILDREEDKVSLQCIDANALARLPVEFSSKTYFVDFGYRGNNPAFEIAFVSLRDPESALLPSTNSDLQQSMQDNEEGTEPISGGGGGTSSSFAGRRQWKASQSVAECETSTLTTLGESLLVNRLHLLPLWRSKTLEEQETSVCQHTNVPNLQVLVSDCKRPWRTANNPDLREYKEAATLQLAWPAVQHLLPVDGSGHSNDSIFAWNERLHHQLLCQNVSLMDWIRLSIRSMSRKELLLRKRTDWDRQLAFREVVATLVLNFAQLFLWKAARLTCPSVNTRSMLLSHRGIECLEREAAKNQHIWKSTLTIYEQYILPLWKSAARKARQSSKNFTEVEGVDHPWSGLEDRQNKELVLTRRSFPLEKLLLFSTRYHFLAYLTQTTFAGTDDISHAIRSLLRKRKRESGSGTDVPGTDASKTTEHNYLAVTEATDSSAASVSFHPPASLLILNAKVLAKEFASEVEAKNCDTPPVFDPALDDIPYYWLKSLENIEKQLSPSQFVDYLTAVLREQRSPEITPLALVAFLADCLAHRRRPVEKGHFAFIQSTRQFMVWDGAHWTKPPFQIDALHFHNCLAISPTKFVSVNGDSSSSSSSSSAGESWEEWRRAEKRAAVEEEADFQRKVRWTPLPPSVESKTLDEKIDSALQVLRCSSRLRFETVFKYHHQVNAVMEDSSDRSSPFSVDTGSNNNVAQRIHDLRLQVLDAARNGADPFVVLSAHADYLGGKRWRLKRSQGTEFLFSLPWTLQPQSQSQSQSPSPTENDCTEEASEWMFREFMGFMSTVSSETPLGRCFSLFENHAIWYDCWSSAPFASLPRLFFSTHYQQLKHHPDGSAYLMAWFCWLLILFSMAFLCPETRAKLYPCLAAAGYPFQHAHPERLAAEKSMHDLIQGFFAPLVVQAPSVETVRLSPFLQTLWLLVQPSTPAGAAPPPLLMLAPNDREKLPVVAVPFVSYHEQVAAIQLRMNQEYAGLLQTKWLDSYEWKKFSQFEAQQLDVSARVLRYVQARSGAWPEPWKTQFEALFAKVADQTVSHAEFGALMKRTVKGPRAFWRERQTDMEEWLSLACKQHVGHAQPMYSLAAAEWFGDSSSSFVYSWRGATNDIVRATISLYLKSMFVLSGAEWVARSRNPLLSMIL